MFVLVGAALWGSYQLIVYGVSQVAGYNVGFADLAIPGRTIDRTKDAPSTSSGSSSSTGNSPAKTAVNVARRAKAGYSTTKNVLSIP
jgi:hypothetical protein